MVVVAVHVELLGVVGEHELDFTLLWEVVAGQPDNPGLSQSYDFTLLGSRCSAALELDF